MGNVLHSSLTFPWLTVDFWSVDNDKSLHCNQVYGLPITEKNSVNTMILQPKKLFAFLLLRSNKKTNQAILLLQLKLPRATTQNLKTDWSFMGGSNLQELDLRRSLPRRGPDTSDLW